MPIAYGLKLLKKNFSNDHFLLYIQVFGLGVWKLTNTLDKWGFTVLLESWCLRCYNVVCIWIKTPWRAFQKTESVPRSSEVWEEKRSANWATYWRYLGTTFQSHIPCLHTKRVKEATDACSNVFLVNFQDSGMCTHPNEEVLLCYNHRLQV